MKDMRPRNIGALLDDAIALYRANHRVILAAAAVSVFPVALMVGVGQNFYLRGFFETFAASPDAPPDALPLEVSLGYAAVMSGSWLLIFGKAFLDAAILQAAPAMLAQRPTEVKPFLKGGWRRYGWYLLTTYAVQAIIALAAVLSLLVLGLAGVAAWVLLSLAAPITVLEQANPVEAMRRSYSLVKRHFWRVFGYLVLVAVLTGLFEGALASPLILRQIVLVAQNPEAVFQRTSVAWKVVEGIMLAASMAIVAPVGPLAMLCLYTDLRARSEGMDLIVRARESASRRA